MRSITIKTGGGGNSAYDEGWHEFTIKTAKYAKGEGSPYLVMTFEDAPETFSCRVYEQKNKEGEEFAIANVFRFANAGLSEEVLTSSDGTNNVTIQLDDKPEHLIGKKLNVLVYKIENHDGTFSRCFKQVAPTALTGVVETFTDSDVHYHKGRAVKQFNSYTPNEAKFNALDERTGLPVSGATVATSTPNGTAEPTMATATDDIPF